MSNFIDFIKKSFYNLSSFILFTSLAVFILLKKLSPEFFSINKIIQLIPIIIGSFFSIVILIFYNIWRNKEYFLIKLHMKKNYIKYDFVAIIISFFSVILLYIISISFVMFNDINNENLALFLTLSAYAIVILIAQGFHQYFLFKVKTDLIKRRSIKNSHLEDKKKLEKNKIKNLEVSAGEFYEK